MIVVVKGLVLAELGIANEGVSGREASALVGKLGFADEEICFCKRVLARA